MSTTSLLPSDPTDRLIIWEKWRNPLTGAGGEDAIAEADPNSLDSDDYLKQEKDDYEFSGLKVLNSNRYNPKLGEFIASPLGLIPLHEHGDAAVIYDFWMAHTNFPITKEVIKLALKVPGVEAWNTFSPYRARVAFGKAFKRAEVIDGIQRVLGVTSKKQVAALLPPSTTGRLDHMRQYLKKYPAWAIFVRKDGEIELSHGSEQEVRHEVTSRPVDSYQEIITSWSDK